MGTFSPPNTHIRAFHTGVPPPPGGGGALRDWTRGRQQTVRQYLSARTHSNRHGNCGVIRLSDNCGVIRLSDNCGVIRLSDNCGVIRLSDRIVSSCCIMIVLIGYWRL